MTKNTSVKGVFWPKAARNVGVLLLIVTVIYPFAVYQSFVSSSHAAAAAVPSSANGSAPAISTQGAASTPPAAAPPPTAPIDTELQKQTSELARYAALIDYLKIFLPVFSALFLAVVGTLGYYFVQSQVLGAVASSTKDLTEKADAARAAMEAANKALIDATASIESLEEAMEDVIDIRLEAAIVSIDHAVSVASWRAPGGCNDAIVYGTRNVERLESLIPRIEESMASALARNDKALHTAIGNRLARLKDYSIAVKADLAYYLAERFKGFGEKNDRSRSLDFSRAIFAEIPQVPDFMERLNIIDNYLYAVSRDTSDLMASDRENFVQLFRLYEDPIRQLLSEETDKEVFADYVRAVSAFEGRATA